MHELVTGDNMRAMQEAVAQDPESVNELNELDLPPLYTAALYRNKQAIAIHSWQLGTLRILLEHGSRLSEEDQQHILRISDNDQELLDELMAIQEE
jgi:hypothetical protein